MKIFPIPRGKDFKNNERIEWRRVEPKIPLVDFVTYGVDVYILHHYTFLSFSLCVREPQDLALLPDGTRLRSRSLLVN